MDNQQLSNWTTVVTNIAVIIGLIFVGLEFRNNSKTLEIERLDHFAEGVAKNSYMVAKDGELSSIVRRSYSEPETLTPDEVVRLENYIIGNSSHISRLYHYRQEGLFPEALWQRELAGAGFTAASDVGIRLLSILQAGEINSPVWGLMMESALRAKAYCENTENECLDRYKRPPSSDPSSP